ncbi:hypothetical protein JL722_5677 [Aureococcus anophagefferens]|nr:hypothetical protein JL722_5677 [Aureococcus anophagefferens]
MAPRPSIAYISSFRETSFTASLDAPQEADENTRSPNPFRNVASSLLQMKNFRYSPAPAADGGDAQMKKEARAACVYLSGTDYLPVGATLLAEFACVGYLATLVGMEAAFGFRDGARFRARAAATAAYAADCVLFLVAEVGFGAHPAFRFAPYLRVALLAVNVTAIYESFEAVVALLPAFFNVSALLALCVGISGWLAAITFDDLDFENREGVDVNDGFDSLGTSIYTMFFVSTTANFPDQMLPSFTYRRTFGLFFFIYVLLAVFIFLNLILAVVYNEYSDFVKGRVIEANRNRARGLNEAFKLLADAKGDDGARRSRATPRSSSSTRTAWSACPRGSGRGRLLLLHHGRRQVRRDLKAEFYDVCDILQYSFVKVRTTTWLQRNRPDVAASPEYARLEAFVKSPLFPRVSMAVLLLNTAVVFLSSYLDLADTLTPGGEEAFAVVEMLFSIAYAALLAAQLAVEPFDEFWLHTSNRFDATVTVVLFGAAVFWALPFVDVSRDVLHRLTILRLGRLLTVLNQVDRFRLICECVAKIVPASTGVVGVLFCAGALWSGAGVQLFGGLVYDGNGALEGSDYLDSHYDVLNFNDFAMGFLPLFAMVTSGGPYTEFVEALNDVSGAKGAGYYFFVSFYVVGVLIFFSASAFVIDNGAHRAMFLEDDDGDDDDDDECGVINQAPRPCKRLCCARRRAPSPASGAA